MADDVIVVPTPPRRPDRDGGSGAATSLLPMLGSVASIALIAGVGGTGQRALIGAGCLLLTSLVVVGIQFDRQHRKAKRQLAESRDDYLAELAGVRSRAQAAVRRQHVEGHAVHPSASGLLARATAGVSPRRPDDPGYLQVRVGTGPTPLRPALAPVDEAALRRADPALVDAVRRFVATYAKVPDQPLVADLRERATIGLGGDRDLARAIVCEAITCHDAADLRVVVAAGERAAREWEWLRWVPTLDTAAHTLVVVDGASGANAGPVTVLEVSAPADPDVGGIGCDLATAEAVARRLTHRGHRSRPPAAGPFELWAGPARQLQVPIGSGVDGEPVRLDMREAAQGGMGPHGLVIGATGSGKSELLRTLVLGLAMTHSPERAQLGAGRLQGRRDLRRAVRPAPRRGDDHQPGRRPDPGRPHAGRADRRDGAPPGAAARGRQLRLVARLREGPGRRRGAEPLPSLFIVVDEFSELLSAKPEFIDLFVAIGRLGRSLGLHLLLASQRLEEGRLRGLESHLSYRIGLRTFSAGESRAVIGVPDAYELPRRPGVGLLRSGPDELTRFDAFYVSDRLEVAVDEVEGARAHQIWLPPLDDSPVLSVFTQGASRLELGLVDRPRAQRHDPLVVELSGAGGHLAIVGAPRSGASTLVSSVLTALATERGPDELELHLLNLTSGLAAASDLPHVASVAGPSQPDLVRRIVRHVDALLRTREAGGEGGPAVVLVVDGWGLLSAAQPDLTATIQAVASRGLAHGIHLVATAHRWSDFRGTVRDLFGSRLELRLGDPLESTVNRRLAATVPARPGRGLTGSGEHFLAALPDAAAVERVRVRWPSRTAPRIQPLPEWVELSELSEVDGLRLGLDEHLATQVLAAQHLVVSGLPGSGRTSALRLVGKEIERRHSPDQAKVLSADARRSLLGEVTEEQLVQHLTGAAVAPAIQELAAHLSGRLPGPDITPERLRRCDWWTGSQVWLLVDDVDLLGPSALAPLLPLLPHASEVGLHVVVSQRGSTRVPDPVGRALLDLGAAHLVLDGTRPGRGELNAVGTTGELQVAWTSAASG